jgi:pilus assembly protein Flp/PilA
MIIKAITMLQSFRKEEDGLALTEYLVLLGLLTGLVISAVILFGGNLGTAWNGWAEWLGTTFGAGGPVDPA